MVPLWFLWLVLGVSFTEAAKCAFDAVTTRNVSNATSPRDPAIWLHPRYPSDSVILASFGRTPSVGTSTASFQAVRLNGQVLTSDAQNAPSNVAVGYGFKLANGVMTDIAVTCEQSLATLRIYALPTFEQLDGGGLPIFVGESDRQCTAVALYKHANGPIYAIVSRRNGMPNEHLWQYLITAAPAAAVATATQANLRLVRKFGELSGKGEIKAVAVDDMMRSVFYADPGCCVRRYPADPTQAAGNNFGETFGQHSFGPTQGSPPNNASVVLLYMNNSQPLTVWAPEEHARSGFILVSDTQQGSTFQAFCRTNLTKPRFKHVGSFMLRGIQPDDGTGVTAANLGNGFSEGALISMSAVNEEFALYNLRHVLSCLDHTVCKAAPPEELLWEQIFFVSIITLMLLASLAFVPYLLHRYGCNGKQARDNLGDAEE